MRITEDALGLLARADAVYQMDLYQINIILKEPADRPPNLSNK